MFANINSDKNERQKLFQEQTHLKEMIYEYNSSSELN